MTANETTSSKQGLRYGLYCGIMALIATLGFSLNLEPVESIALGKVNPNAWYCVAATLRNSWSECDVKTIFAFLGIYLLCYYAFRVGNKTLSHMSRILSAVLSFFYVVGYSFNLQDNWELAFGNHSYFVRALIAYAGYWVLFYAVLVALYHVLHTADLNKISAWLEEKLSFFSPEETTGLLKSKKNIQIFCALTGVFVLLWLPYLIIYYPGTTSGDTYDMLFQTYGVETWSATISKLIDPNVMVNNHHPVLHTWIFRLFIELGQRITGNENNGVFFYAICQMLLQSVVLTTSVYFMLKEKFPKIIPVVSTFIYAFWPIFALWAICMNKDTSYAFWNLQETVLLTMIVYSAGKVLKNKWFCIGLGFVNMMMMMTRSNGRYAMVFITVALLLVYRKEWKRIIVIYAGTFLLFSIGFIKLLLPALSISSSDSRAFIYIPAQQTARYIVEHEEEITEEDKEIISKVFDYDKIKANYQPRHTTVVTQTFYADASKESISEYMKVWFKYLKKRPGLYVEAAMNLSYGYFYPGSGGILGFVKFDEKMLEDERTKPLHFYHRVELKKIRAHMNVFIRKTMQRIPVIGVFASKGTAPWILFLGVGYLIVAKKKRFIVAYIPSLTNILVCMMAPKCVFRYMLPEV
nr:DUF6020 family protein [Lachnospiraceae bacterium]